MHCTEHGISLSSAENGDQPPIASLQQYRYRKQGLQLIADIGFRNAMAFYMGSPSGVRGRLQKKEDCPAAASRGNLLAPIKGEETKISVTSPWILTEIVNRDRYPEAVLWQMRFCPATGPVGTAHAHPYSCPCPSSWTASLREPTDNRLMIA